MKLLIPIKFSVFLLIYQLVIGSSYAQHTFKTVWKTYNTGQIIHEYTCSYTHTDSARLYITDSSKTYVSTDSLVTMTEYYKNRDNAIYKTIHYMNAKKQLLKTEEYKDDAIVEINEWKYDDKNRKRYHYKDNKLNGNSYRKQYEYIIDKKAGDRIVVESSYFNNRIEFYTKMYYDEKNVMLKEVRLNDNNKDVIHIETYTYGENGKVKERSVYFPEFQVTKKFSEPAGNIPVKCFATLPVGIADKVNPGTKIAYVKRVIAKNQSILSDPGCKDYEFTFTNFSNCMITIATTKVNNGKIVRYKYKERK
ncbi:MAG: hypothetical protein K9G49_07115 [Taibaiella sp.]|nr:hypothetical protein [Taibaiella sp.]